MYNPWGFGKTDFQSFLPSLQNHTASAAPKATTSSTSVVPETAASSGQRSWFTDDETKILITIWKENYAWFQGKKRSRLETGNH